MFTFNFFPGFFLLTQYLKHAHYFKKSSHKALSRKAQLQLQLNFIDGCGMTPSRKFRQVALVSSPCNLKCEFSNPNQEVITVAVALFSSVACACGILKSG